MSALTISDITATAARLDAYDGHERVWLGKDAERGLTAVVAIHNTAPGPAAGGTRVWRYDSFEAALIDALRLSHGMTFKSAVAGVPFGGGKAVIMADPETGKTPGLLDAYAEMLQALDGQFYTGEDVNLSLADADFLRARTPNVVGTTTGGSGDPSPVTAHGVFLGLKSALRHRFGSDALSGIRVAVQGLGSVGRVLCERLHAEGAELILADIDGERARQAVASFGARAAEPDAILSADADVLAPCALGGVLSAETIVGLKVKVVAGSANNQLAGDDDAWLLMRSGILYAPDFVINAGGLINVVAELAPGGYDREMVMRDVERIPQTLGEIFVRAEAEGRPTNEIANAIAMERITASRSSS